MNLVRSFNFLALIALLSVLTQVNATPGCPFCSSQGKTLLEEVNDSSMVLYGTFKNAKNNGQGEGTTDLEIDAVIKSHEMLGNKKLITLEKYILPTTKDKKWLVFCDIFKGKIDPFLGKVLDADSGIDTYLTEAQQYKDRKKDPAKRLRFFFNYLDHKESEIAHDALKEWAYSDYQDYRDMAKDLPAEKLAEWLNNKETSGNRIGLYASLLGHCGKKEHVKVLRDMLTDPNNRVYSGIDGILAGYVLLAPTEGWQKVSDLLSDDKQKFSVRYAALRTARFFWDYRLDVVSKKDVIGTIEKLLDQGDIADLAIEDLRKRGEWEPSEHVLGLYGKKSHDIPIIRRAILRFALSVPKEKDANGNAAAFVEKLRDKDPELVKSAEELLELEAGTPK